jgi:hypothetical protein
MDLSAMPSCSQNGRKMLTKIMYLLDVFVWMVNLLANPELNELSGALETSSENSFTSVNFSRPFHFNIFTEKD